MKKTAMLTIGLATALTIVTAPQLMAHGEKPQFGELAGSCKACHDDYRSK